LENPGLPYLHQSRPRLFPPISIVAVAVEEEWEYYELGYGCSGGADGKACGEVAFIAAWFIKLVESGDLYVEGSSNLLHRNS